MEGLFLNLPKREQKSLVLISKKQCMTNSFKIAHIVEFIRRTFRGIVQILLPDMVRTASDTSLHFCKERR